MKLTANKDSLFNAAANMEGYSVQDEFKQFQTHMRPTDIMSNKIWITEKKPLIRIALT